MTELLGNLIALVLQTGSFMLGAYLLKAERNGIGPTLLCFLSQLAIGTASVLLMLVSPWVAGAFFLIGITMAMAHFYQVGYLRGFSIYILSLVIFSVALFAIALATGSLDRITNTLDIYLSEEVDEIEGDHQ